MRIATQQQEQQLAALVSTSRKSEHGIEHLDCVARWNVHVLREIGADCDEDDVDELDPLPCSARTSSTSDDDYPDAHALSVADLLVDLFLAPQSTQGCRNAASAGSGSAWCISSLVADLSGVGGVAERPARAGPTTARVCRASRFGRDDGRPC